MDRVSELDRELADAPKVPVELRLPLTQHAEKHVSHLPLRRTGAAALRRVHPAVREAQGGARIVGLLGQEDDAAELPILKPSPCAVSAEDAAAIGSRACCV